MLISALTSSDDGERLNLCLPMLVDAVDNWAATGITDHPIVIAVATARSARVLRADSWPQADEGSTTAIAAAVIAAVESPNSVESCHIIVAGVSLLLGPMGRSVYAREATAIRKRGEVPVFVLMLADAATRVGTTLAVARPTLH